MQQQPPAFINVPVSQMPAPAMQIPPQAVQNQAPSQLQMQQRFQAPIDPSNQLPPHEQVYAELSVRCPKNCAPFVWLLWRSCRAFKQLHRSGFNLE